MIETKRDVQRAQASSGTKARTAPRSGRGAFKYKRGGTAAADYSAKLRAATRIVRRVTHSLTLAPHAVSSSQSEREQHGRGAVRGVRADGQARGRTREAHDGQGRAAALRVAQVPQVEQKVRVPQERAASLWQQAATACGCGQQSHRGPAAGRGQPQTLQGGHRVGVGQQSVTGGSQQSLQQHQPSQ